MRALLILLIVPAFALGLAVGATRVVGQPTPPVVQPTGFIWADRVFVSGHDLDSWLKSRGSSYQQWAARHPGVAETFPLAAKRALVAPKQSAGGGSEPAWWNVLLTVLAVGSAVTLVLYLIDQRRPGIWRELAHETGSLGRIRPDRGSEPAHAHMKLRLRLEDSRDAFHRGWGSVRPRLAHVGPEALKRGRAAASATRPMRRRIRRRYLSQIVFYAAAVVLAFAIGAAISGYLN
jgi:hypothetical protein